MTPSRPLPVAAVLTSRPGIVARDTTDARSRIVVFGDSDFLSDFEISNAGNLTVAMNSVN